MLTLKKTLASAVWSSVGKKYVMAVSGMLLLGFLVTHLAANLLLYLPDGALFNAYPVKLQQTLGPFFIASEIGLGALFLLHAFMAIGLKLKAKAARPVAYAATGSRNTKSKGGPSKSNASSLYMIVSGAIILAFLIIHIKQFRFGAGITDGYMMTLADGTVARDLYKLVVETFQNPMYVALYCLSMLLLGLHLRHGFWSFFQSLGLMHPKVDKLIYCIGVFVAFILSAGFFFIPIWIYFDLYAKLFGN